MTAVGHSEGPLSGAKPMTAFDPKPTKRVGLTSLHSGSAATNCSFWRVCRAGRDPEVCVLVRRNWRRRDLQRGHWWRAEGMQSGIGRGPGRRGGTGRGVQTGIGGGARYLRRNGVSGPSGVGWALRRDRWGGAWRRTARLFRWRAGGFPEQVLVADARMVTIDAPRVPGRICGITGQRDRPDFPARLGVSPSATSSVVEQILAPDKRVIAIDTPRIRPRIVWIRAQRYRFHRLTGRSVNPSSLRRRRSRQASANEGKSLAKHAHGVARAIVHRVHSHLPQFRPMLLGDDRRVRIERERPEAAMALCHQLHGVDATSAMAPMPRAPNPTLPFRMSAPTTR